MKIRVDTNIIAGFWAGTPEGQSDLALLRQRQAGGDMLLVSGVVYIELCAAPSMTRTDVDAFLRAAQISTDFVLPAPAWEAAADANAAH